MSNSHSMVCEVPGCTKPVRSKAMCNAHVLRWYRHGTTDALNLPPAEGPLTAERLRLSLDYSPESGIFTRRAGGRRGRAAGHPAKSGKRLVISVDGRAYYAHRLAWMYVHGEWPKGVIDHIDGNAFNNRLANLRDVTPVVNLQNQRSPSIRNKTGFLGVLKVPSTGRFSAQIQAEGKSRHIGTFDTPEAAHEAYVLAKRQLHPGNTL